MGGQPMALALVCAESAPSLWPWVGEPAQGGRMVAQCRQAAILRLAGCAEMGKQKSRFLSAHGWPWYRQGMPWVGYGAAPSLRSVQGGQPAPACRDDKRRV